MAMAKKLADYRQKEAPALQEELLALRRERFNLKMQHAVQQSGKHDRLKSVRRDIARVLTVINEKGEQQ